MSKFKKYIIKPIIAVLGACSVVFDILTPIVISLILISYSSLTEGIWYQFQINMLLIGGLCASLYRGIKHLIWIGKENE